MGSSDGIESIGALFEPALAGEEIARICSKIRLKASEPMLFTRCFQLNQQRHRELFFRLIPAD
jgi:hypothetical protein